MGSKPSLEATRRKLSASSVITSHSSSWSRNNNSSQKATKQPDHLLHVFEGDSSITCTAISEDLSMLISGCDNGVITIWSALSTPPENLTTLTGHKVRTYLRFHFVTTIMLITKGGITCLSMTEKHIISGSEDGLLVKWSVAAMEAVYVFRGHSSKINHVIASDKYIFSSSYDRTAKAWKANQEDEHGTNCDSLICTFRVPLI